MMKEMLVVPLGLLFLLLFAPQPGLTQPAEELQALRKEIESLKEGQSRIQRELLEIKSLLRGRHAHQKVQQPEKVVLQIDDDPFKGDARAKVTLIDFTDYQ
jgi:protein-disulfide isomerase